jgi:hypothetical protein
LCFIGTKGIKSISSEKFTPLKVFDMASIYKGYIDSFVPTATGIIAILVFYDIEKILYDLNHLQTIYLLHYIR